MFYLFPFGKVPPSEGIIVYGAGVIGQSFLKQLGITQLFSTIFVTDKNITSTRSEGNIVFLSEGGATQLPAFPIVVASIKFGDEIKQHLLLQGIDADRVITLDTDHALEESQFEPHTFDWNEYYNNAEA